MPMWNKILPLFLLSGLVQAEEIKKFPEAVVAFENHAEPGSILFLSASGQAEWFKSTHSEKTSSYSVADAACTPRSQNTGNGGLTLAYPFLVGAGTACFIDEAQHSIRLLSNFSDQLPSGAFAAVYAGSSAESAYFVINGRTFPDGEEGYLMLVSIDLKSHAVGIRPLATAVPDFSGGMLKEGSTIWVSTWPGAIYKMDLSALQALIQKGGTAPFSELATLQFHDFEGMNAFLLANDSSFLYFNAGDESYLIDRATGERKVVSTSCEPLMGLKEKWLVLCEGKSLEIKTLP